MRELILFMKNLFTHSIFIHLLNSLYFHNPAVGICRTAVFDIV